MQSEPILTTHSAFNAVGIEVRTDNTLEMDPSKAKIPGLWGKFFQEGTPEKIPSKKPRSIPLGIYTDYETDHQGPYSLVAGVETTDLKSIPNGMRGLAIPGGKYLVFTATGQMPKALIETWMYIWSYFSKNSNYKRTYTTDFERYESSEKVEIYIAVK
jgi:predicted transcriptional regulator YdeE